MKIFSLLPILLASLLASQALAMGEVAVFPVSATDLASGEDETIGVLFAEAYGRVSGQQILLPEDTRAIVKAAGNLHAAAQALAVGEYVDLIATRRGGKVELIAGLFSNEGVLNHKVEMSVASLDDFRATVERFARALFERKSVEEVRRAPPAPAGGYDALAGEMRAGPAAGHAPGHSTTGPRGGEVAIFPVRGTNLGQGAVAAIGVIFGHAYAQVSGQSVLLPDETARFLRAAGSEAKAAEVLAVAQFIVLRAVRLDTKIQVVGTLYGQDGQRQHLAEVMTLNLDDFQNVSKRLAHALYTRQATGQPSTVAPAAPVTTAAPVTPARPSIEWIVGFKLQISFNLAVGLAIDPTVSGLFDIRFEGESYFIEAGVGGMFPSSSWQDSSFTVRRYGGLIGELGFSWYFLNGDISLYGGGGILPKLIGGDALDPGVRIAFYGQFGATFFRESAVRLYTDLRVAQNVMPYQYFSWERNEAEEFYPTEITISVGFGF